MPVGVYEHKPHTEITKKKMSETRKRLGIRPPSWKGKKHSIASKEKIRNSLNGHIVSDVTRKKLLEARMKQENVNTKNLVHAKKGKENINWKGGITPIRRLIRNSREYKKWRSEILKMDDYTCKICKQRGRKLHVDHYPKSFSLLLRRNKIDAYDKAMVCNELWDINNGRTLCKTCHEQTENFGGKGLMREKTNCTAVQCTGEEKKENAIK
jgi:hypothetical protein